ncbi:endo-polygalacturonase [Sarracenia purpurea var. burkii]
MTDSTDAFLGAWASACASAQPAMIYVPPGRFLVRNANFSGQNCKSAAVAIRVDAMIVAPSDYRVIGNAGNWLKFESVSGVSISGGVLNGNGTGLWACKASGKSCPTGATVCKMTKLPFTPCLSSSITW